MSNVKIDVPTHPSVRAMAEAKVDPDDMIAFARKHFATATPNLRQSEEMLRQLVPAIRETYAKGATDERMRIVNWLNSLAQEALDKKTPVRAQVFMQLATQLFKSVTETETE